MLNKKGQLSNLIGVVGCIGITILAVILALLPFIVAIFVIIFIIKFFIKKSREKNQISSVVINEQ